MNIFSIILEKCKNFFKRKEKVLILNEAKECDENKRENFRKKLQVIVEKSIKNKKVETHLSFGDGLGIDNKMKF